MNFKSNIVKSLLTIKLVPKTYNISTLMKVTSKTKLLLWKLSKVYLTILMLGSLNLRRKSNVVITHENEISSCGDSVNVSKHSVLTICWTCAPPSMTLFIVCKSNVKAIKLQVVKVNCQPGMGKTTKYEYKYEYMSILLHFKPWNKWTLLRKGLYQTAFTCLKLTTNIFTVNNKHIRTMPLSLLLTLNIFHTLS